MYYPTPTGPNDVICMLAKLYLSPKNHRSTFTPGTPPRHPARHTSARQLRSICALLPRIGPSLVLHALAHTPRPALGTQPASTLTRHSLRHLPRCKHKRPRTRAQAGLPWVGAQARAIPERARASGALHKAIFLVSEPKGSRPAARTLEASAANLANESNEIPSQGAPSLSSADACDSVGAGSTPLSSAASRAPRDASWSSKAGSCVGRIPDEAGDCRVGLPHAGIPGGLCAPAKLTYEACVSETRAPFSEGVKTFEGASARGIGGELARGSGGMRRGEGVNGTSPTTIGFFYPRRYREVCINSARGRTVV